MKEIAINYAYEGFSVIPLTKDKRPIISSVDFDYLYTPMSEVDIEEYFNGAEFIGIACNNFEAIDFDRHNNRNIDEIFNSFIEDDYVKSVINKYNLPIIKTPSGGYHIYYKCETIEPSQKLAMWDDNTTMIETRGRGGYVATIPSPGYTHLRGTELVKLNTIEPDERKFLLRACEAFTQQAVNSEATGSGKWKGKWDIATAWGKYNEECLDEAKDLLIAAGWEYLNSRKRDGVEMWLRPGKETKPNGSQPVSATIGAMRNMFYNFSTSTEHFEARKGYTPFDIFLKLKHSGDKKAAIIDLEKRFNIVHYKPSFNKKYAEFPLSVFPDEIVEYLNELKQQNNFDINVTASAFIWIVSILIGNKIVLNVNNSWKISPVLWMMLIAERGSSKTHAINAIINPVKKIDKKNKNLFDEELSHYDPEDKTSKRPIFKQLILEDGTREGYTKAMIHNPGGLGLVKDELHGWLSDMDKHSGGKGGDEAFWISSFNNSDYRKNIKSEDTTFVERMFIGLIGSIQPHILDEFSKRHTDNGMFDRFLLIPYEEKPFKFKINNTKVSKTEFYSNFLNTIYISLAQMEEQNAGFNPEAIIEFENKYNEFLNIRYNADDFNIRAYVSKIISYLPRISLVFEIIDQFYNNKSGDFTLLVNKNSVLKAYDVLRFFISNAEDVLFDINNSDDFKNIIKAANAIKRTDKARVLIDAMNRNEIDTTQAKIAHYLKMSKQQVNYLVNKSKQK